MVAPATASVSVADPASHAVHATVDVAALSLNCPGGQLVGASLQAWSGGQSAASKRPNLPTGQVLLLAQLINAVPCGESGLAADCISFLQSVSAWQALHSPGQSAAIVSDIPHAE